MPVETIQEDSGDDIKVEDTQASANSPFTFLEIVIEGDTLIATVAIFWRLRNS